MTDYPILSRMSESETIEYLGESLKSASDLARQLAKAQGKQKWVEFADLLERIHHKTQILSTARAINRIDTLVLLEREKKKLMVN